MLALITWNVMGPDGEAVGSAWRDKTQIASNAIAILQETQPLHVDRFVGDQTVPLLCALPKLWL